MGEFQGKSHCWPKIIQRLVSHLSKNILIFPKTFGQIFCGLMLQKLTFLEGLCPVTSGIKPTHFIKRTSYNSQTWWWWCDGLGLLCSFRTWMTCHNWWNHDFCTLSENPEGEYLAVRLWPQAQAHLGHAAGQWSQTHQQVHLWIEMLLHDLKQSKTIQCGWIKTILQRRVGQNSSTAMWKTRCQLSQMRDCRCCCKGRQNQL